MYKKKSSFYIYGRKPVEEALLHDPKNVAQVIVHESVKDEVFEELKNYVRKHKIPFIKSPKNKLESLVGDVNDQGVVAELKEFRGEDIHDWMETLDLESNPLVFVMDELEDPHNVGAVIRVAAASGAAGVILSKHRQAPVNGTVFKTSAGTITKVPIVIVSNINDAIKKLKEHKFWVVGLDVEKGKNVWEEAYDTPTAVVIGNEGEGMRDSVKKSCDYTIQIPMERDVESLNASVSAAIVAYEWKRKNS
jgi:23S rRNA (guanosine2251-2'-O)-methyltransferase